MLVAFQSMKLMHWSMSLKAWVQSRSLCWSPIASHPRLAMYPYEGTGSSFPHPDTPVHSSLPYQSSHFTKLCASGAAPAHRTLHPHHPHWVHSFFSEEMWKQLFDLRCRCSLIAPCVLCSARTRTLGGWLCVARMKESSPKSLQPSSQKFSLTQ